MAEWNKQFQSGWFSEIIHRMREHAKKNVHWSHEGFIEKILETDGSKFDKNEAQPKQEQQKIATNNDENHINFRIILIELGAQRHPVIKSTEMNQRI